MYQPRAAAFGRGPQLGIRPSNLSKQSQPNYYVFQGESSMSSMPPSQGIRNTTMLAPQPNRTHGVQHGLLGSSWYESDSSASNSPPSTARRGLAASPSPLLQSRTQLGYHGGTAGSAQVYQGRPYGPERAIPRRAEMFQTAQQPATSQYVNNNLSQRSAYRESLRGSSSNSSNEWITPAHANPRGGSNMQRSGAVHGRKRVYAETLPTEPLETPFPIRRDREPVEADDFQQHEPKRRRRLAEVVKAGGAKLVRNVQAQSTKMIDIVRNVRKQRKAAERRPSPQGSARRTPLRNLGLGMDISPSTRDPMEYAKLRNIQRAAFENCHMSMLEGKLNPEQPGPHVQWQYLSTEERRYLLWKHKELLYAGAWVNGTEPFRRRLMDLEMFLQIHWGKETTFREQYEAMIERSGNRADPGPADRNNPGNQHEHFHRTSGSQRSGWTTDQFT